jgi:hypothetical protein
MKTKRSMHPNSLKNLENRVTIDKRPEDRKKGVAVRKERVRIRKLLNEKLTPEMAEELVNVIYRKAIEGNPKFMEMAISLNENWKNRELELKKKEVKTAERLADHVEGLKIQNKPIEVGEVIPYEETGRTVE